MLIGEFSGKPFNIDVNKVYKDRYTKTVYVSTVSAKTMTNKMQKQAWGCNKKKLL